LVAVGVRVVEKIVVAPSVIQNKVHALFGLGGVGKEGRKGGRKEGRKEGRITRSSKVTFGSKKTLEG
jgi:hypothetical protein